MKVRLLKDIIGEDKDGNKFVRSTVRFSRGIAFEWRAGKEFEVSEATGAKWIKGGVAQEVKPAK